MVSAKDNDNISNSNKNGRHHDNISFPTPFPVWAISPKKSSWCSFVTSLRCPGALGSWIVTRQVPEVMM